jgi:superfamily II DNA or RNA helicase
MQLLTLTKNTARVKRRLFFNTTIEHSNLVHECFKNAGYKSRSLDSQTATPETRKETLQWLKDTPDAILNNVGILTAGFDEPTIEAIIFNRTTKSLPLWLQCCGRGARLSPETGKDHFVIIDLGDNINGEQHHQWHFRHDWKERFFQSKKGGRRGTAYEKLPGL